MAKYKEVKDKQEALEKMEERDEPMNKALFVGFTFRHRRGEGDKAVSPRKRVDRVDEDDDGGVPETML